jgi:hypothetical protein
LRSRWIRAATIGTIAGLGLAAPAAAQQNRPWVSAPPATTGSAVVGSTLTSVGGQAGGPRGTTVGRAWLRCSGADERSCQLIGGAWNTSTYTLTGNDLGKRIRSALYAYHDYPRDLVWKMSPPTAPVANPAPAPTPTPTPTPTPLPAPAPVQPVAQPLPTQQAQAPKTTVVTRAKRMKPFPVVRISGVLTPNGAQVSRLTVKAPRHARITVKCSGSGCPKRRVARRARTRLVHVPQFETYLRAGVKLTITVAKPGYISKVTTIRIRRAAAPLRSDLCRAPGAKRPSRCPRR